MMNKKYSLIIIYILPKEWVLVKQEDVTTLFNDSVSSGKTRETTTDDDDLIAKRRHCKKAKERKEKKREKNK